METQTKFVNAPMQAAFRRETGKGLSGDYKISANGFVEPGAPAVSRGSNSDEQRVESLKERLSKSPTGKKTLEIAEKAGYTFALEGMIGSNGGCSKSKKKIVLNPMFKDDQLLAVLAHEARHAGQFERGETDSEDLSAPRKYDIKSEIMQYRAVEADAQANAAQCLFEMMEAGDMDPFREFARTSPEIANAYANAAYHEDDVKNGKARTQAFLGWYDNNKIKDAYEHGYQTYVMQEHEGKGIDDKDTYDQKITASDIVKNLCVNESGENYFTEKPETLAQGQYVDIGHNTKKFLDEYFTSRTERTGQKADESYKKLDVRPKDPFAPEYTSYKENIAKPEDNKKSVDARQEEAKKEIGIHKRQNEAKEKIESARRAKELKKKLMEKHGHKLGR